MDIKKIDVIIPVYRPGKEFTKLLEQLELQDYPISRIIIMHTEDGLWKEKWEKEHPILEVYHLKKTEFDHGGTRKKASELSDGEIMIFMTQDASPADTHLITHLVKALTAQDDIAAAYARQLPAPSCSFVESYTRTFNYPEKSSVKTKKDLSVYGLSLIHI